MIFRKRGTKRRTVGIDVGRDSIRMVEVTPHIGVTEARMYPRSDPSASLVEEAAHLKQRWKLHGANVFLALSAADTFSRTALIPKHEGASERLRRIHSLAHHTLPLESITYDFFIGPTEREQESFAFLAFAHSAVINQSRQFVRLLGGNPQGIDIDVLVLFRLWCSKDIRVSQKRALILHLEEKTFRGGIFYEGRPCCLRASIWSNPEELMAELKGLLHTRGDAHCDSAGQPLRAFVYCCESFFAPLRDLLSTIEAGGTIVQHALQCLPSAPSTQNEQTFSSSFAVAAWLAVHGE